jgi:hypothetical protein
VRKDAQSVKLNPLVKKKLEKLKAQNPAAAVEVLRDWDALQRLNDLAYKITEPGDRSEVEGWANVGVKVSNVTLHELSLGAYMWATERAAVWFQKRPFWQDIAIAYAMAYSRRPAHLRRITSRSECKAALKLWLRSCGATYNELMSAIKSICGDAEETEQSDEAKTENDSYGPVVALLCREYGATPEYWIWNANLTQVRGLLLEYDAKIRAEAQAMRKANGSQASVAPNPADPYIKACRALQVAWSAFEKTLTEGIEDG